MVWLLGVVILVIVGSLGILLASKNDEQTVDDIAEDIEIV